MPAAARNLRFGVAVGAACLAAAAASLGVSLGSSQSDDAAPDGAVKAPDSGGSILLDPAIASADYAIDLRQITDGDVQLCQALGPAAPFCIEGVDSAYTDGCRELGWGAMGPIMYQQFAQGEYVGPARAPHVPEYRVRVDDQLEFLFRLTREPSPGTYRITVGDQFELKSFADERLELPYLVQPDGYITVNLLEEPIRAAGLTFAELRDVLNERYSEFYNDPAISIIPIEIDTRLDDLQQTVQNFAGQGGQAITRTVTPEGSVSLPVLGTIFVQGLSIPELEQEINARYAEHLHGLEVTVNLGARAPRFIYVLGEVAQPGRFELTGPTTVMSAIALAEGWNIGANTRHIVVFRRADDWRLMATVLDVRRAIYGGTAIPSDEIWLRDSDIVVVPKSPVLVATEIIELLFARGLYTAFPLTFESVSGLLSRRRQRGDDRRPQSGRRLFASDAQSRRIP